MKAKPVLLISLAARQCSYIILFHLHVCTLQLYNTESDIWIIDDMKMLLDMPSS